ncbi:gliding motility lipoprotein GldB [Flavobacteriaceae bacterium]|nr:gliding motility lipoprotein GldB [Flavobacteriaceae bacterium]
MHKFLIFLIIFLTFSCNNVNTPKVEVEIERFEDIFFKSNANNLYKVKENFSFLFPPQYEDQIWIDRLNDTIQNQLYNEVNLSFGDFSDQQSLIESFYSNYLGYDSEYKIPRLITLTTDVDYRKKIILTDSLLLIGLDNYLGEDHVFYSSFPTYLTNTFNKENIIIDIAKEYATAVIANTRSDNYTFIEKIINHGKMLYFASLMLPEKEESKIIGYTNADFAWALKNEKDIWSNFIENDYLFSSDNNLDSRFINLAPFSKFYLSIDNDSPSMIGKFIGWKIVKSFMKVSSSNLNELIQYDPMYIYNNSKYKPSNYE